MFLAIVRKKVLNGGNEQHNRHKIREMEMCMMSFDDARAPE